MEAKPATSLLSVADVRSYISAYKWRRDRPPFSEHTVIVITFLVAGDEMPRPAYSFTEILGVICTLF